MQHIESARFWVEDGSGWPVLGLEANDSATGFASSWFAAPAFFIAWIGLGVSIGLVLARRGHERRTMVAIGAGLGPLMFIVASDTLRRRDPLAQLLVLAPGYDHGGDLDVVVLLRGRPEDVESAAPNLSAVRSDIGLVTLATAVDFEALEAGVEDEAVRAATDTLVAARDLVPIVSPALVVCAGKPERVVEQFARPGQRTLVLYAVGHPSTSAGPE